MAVLECRCGEGIIFMFQPSKGERVLWWCQLSSEGGGLPQIAVCCGGHPGVPTNGGGAQCILQ
jgi:hypothetical protein